MKTNDPADPKTLLKTSTFFDAQFSIPAMFGFCDGDSLEPDELLRLPMVDFLDGRVLRALRDAPSNGSIVKDASPLTTSVHSATGTTTVWWLIVMYNGYLHPDEIPDGTVLKIPNLASIRDALAKSKQGLGKIVTI